MVIPLWQVFKLLAEPLLASVVLARLAPAVTTPVTD
jgi:hypothetical protein